MSEKADKMLCCASCGIAGGGGDVKLKDCSACKIVKYCGIECQRRHRKEHKEECKKRAAELRDEILFKQPEISCLGDCPICCLPHSIVEKNALSRCCSKRICCGCHYANTKREIEEGLERKCPFCRNPRFMHESHTLKRAEANDPVALFGMGEQRADEGDFGSAFECFTKAVEFGNYAEAHFRLAGMYYEGHVGKDEKMFWYHLEEAAIGGVPEARHNLAGMEFQRGRKDRAVKHWIIAANMGNGISLEVLKNAYRKGLVSKEDLASALRGHQAAVDATKSPLREEARVFMSSIKMK